MLSSYHSAIDQKMDEEAARDSSHLVNSPLHPKESPQQVNSTNNNEDSSHLVKATNHYDENVDYDPCREWLRLVVAIACVCVAGGAAYPINLGAECFWDNRNNGILDLSHCEKLFSIEYSLTVLSVSLLCEALALAMFFYACRHEFCGVKRRYTTGFLGNGGTKRPRSAKVHPADKAVPPAPTYSSSK